MSAQSPTPREIKDIEFNSMSDSVVAFKILEVAPIGQQFDINDVCYTIFNRMYLDTIGIEIKKSYFDFMYYLQGGKFQQAINILKERGILYVDYQNNDLATLTDKAILVKQLGSIDLFDRQIADEITFPTHQRRFNKYQLWIAFSMAIFTIIQIFIAYGQLHKDEQNIFRPYVIIRDSVRNKAVLNKDTIYIMLQSNK